MYKDNYIQNRQEKMTTSSGVIDATFEEMIGEPLIEKTRIFAGEDNEVYLVITKKEEVILRISRKGPIEFQKEQWAMNQCKNLSIPVAAMLAIKDVEYEGMMLSFCIQTKIEGDSLSRGSMDYRDLNKETLKQIIVRSGAILSKIHSISTKGFGVLDGEGNGPFQTFQELLESRILSEEEAKRFASETGCDYELLKKSADYIKNNSKKFSDIQPVLVHRDFDPKHIFVNERYEITGIIDFGAVYGHSPICDFAIWDYWLDDLPLEWLKEGYENKDLFFNEDFEKILFLLKLDLALHLLKVYHERNYEEGVEDAKEKLQGLCINL